MFDQFYHFFLVFSLSRTPCDAWCLLLFVLEFKPMKVSRLSLKLASDQLEKARKDEETRQVKVRGNTMLSASPTTRESTL